LQPDRFSGVKDRLQMRPHQAAEIGQMRQIALAGKERAAEFLLQTLDRLGQRRLGDPTILGGAGKVERLAQRHEVAHLVHFHSGPLWPEVWSIAGKMQVVRAANGA